MQVIGINEETEDLRLELDTDYRLVDPLSAAPRVFWVVFQGDAVALESPYPGDDVFVVEKMIERSERIIPNSGEVHAMPKPEKATRTDWTRWSKKWEAKTDRAFCRHLSEYAKQCDSDFESVCVNQ